MLNTTSFLINHPAHLWIADEQTLQKNVIKSLQNIFCNHQGCTQCHLCIQIANKQHHNVFWIEPENNYTLDLIDQTLENTRFSLSPNEYRFFIFNKADTFNPHCNNRLLKTIEEPSAGYIFIFLATNTQNILSTVISRCLVKEFHDEFVSNKFANLTELLFNAHINHTLNFLKMLEQFEIKEHETKQILDCMIQIAYEKLSLLHKQNMHDTQQMIKITNMIILITEALQQLPAPGSAKIFWKNFYLQLLT